jgi:hypothetical protein
MSPEGPPGDSLKDSDVAKREHGRQLAMEGLLEWVFRRGGALEVAHRRRRIRRIAIGSAAPALALAVLGYLGFRGKEAAPPSTVGLPVLAETQGRVFLIEGKARRAARPGETLAAGRGLAILGRGSRAVVTYADGTRVELGPETHVDGVEETEKGKRVLGAAGWLAARVARQPAGRPMVFATPHGEATIAGTSLRVLIHPGDEGSTRVEVDEGKVRFRRRADGKLVEVVSGHTAVAAAGVDFTPRKIEKPSAADPDVLREDFESCAPGVPLDGQGGWTGGRPPGLVQASVRAGAGVNGSKGLALWQEGSESLYPWTYGVRRVFAEPLTGIYWLQCSFKPPATGRVPFHLDLRAGTEYAQILFLVSAALGQDQGTEHLLSAHASWQHPYWRLYRTVEGRTDRWHTFTVRMDFDRGVYAAWIDRQVLGDELPMAHAPPAAWLHLSMAGTPEAPALVDDLVITRLAPEGFERPAPLPPRRPGLLFRFAGMGDFRLGDADYDIKRLFVKRAAAQINRAGAEMTFLLGHFGLRPTEEQAYRDLASDLGTLVTSWYPVRGPRDPPGFFRTHFRKEPASYSITQNGVRFVLVDPGVLPAPADEELSWLESEFKKARDAGEEIIVGSFASPWNKTYVGKVGRVAPDVAPRGGAERLKGLLKEYRVLLFLSSHYPSGPWHEEEDGTHFLTCGGPVLRKGSPAGWSLFDVYGDRIELHFKPMFSGCPAGDSDEYVSGVAPAWDKYDPAFPYVRGPLTFRRHRPARAGP